MKIGDWEILVVDTHSFKTRPGDDNSETQVIITYDFKFIPESYHIVRTIHYIKPITDDDREIFLINFTNGLKTTFIDTRVFA